MLRPARVYPDVTLVGAYINLALRVEAVRRWLPARCSNHCSELVTRHADRYGAAFTRYSREGTARSLPRPLTFNSQETELPISLGAKTGHLRYEMVRDMTTRPSDLGLPEDVELLAPDWPSDPRPHKVLPGDLLRFAANQGPTETDLATFHPFRFDPKINAGGGLIYFDECVDFDILKATLGLMGVYPGMKDYATFAACAANPVADDYLDQVRFISHHALECGYFVGRGPFAEQRYSLWEIIETFIAGQRKKWSRGELRG